MQDSDFLLLAGDTDDCDGTVMAELVSGAVVAQLGPSKCLDLQGDLAAVEMTPSHDAFLSEEGFTVEAWVFAKSEDLRAESFMNPGIVKQQKSLFFFSFLAPSKARNPERSVLAHSCNAAMFVLFVLSNSGIPSSHVMARPLVGSYDSVGREDWLSYPT